MSKPTAEVKNRWNSKAYDRIALFVPKGERERLKQIAADNGTSLNGLINTAIAEYLKSF
jgi:predicted HicB family RNase H-like nuclease